ncbi:MAG: L,D-transpeptidase [Pseudomonadota bacterium]
MQSKRTFLLGAAAALAAPSLVQAQAGPTRNASSFVTQDWQDHFETLGKGAILADITSRAVHYWGPDGTYRLFPSSVPLTEELTRRGYTEVVRKALAPSWTPTASMRERMPELPERIEGGDPSNPLGTHAMYLTWPAYLIHGTHDTRKIGRQSSSGCIGLYNEHIAELYALTDIGTQVRLF